MSIFTIDIIINYDKNSDIGYTLVIDANYLEYFHSSHKDLPLLHEEIVIDGATKLLCTFHDKKKFMSHNIFTT